MLKLKIGSNTAADTLTRDPTRPGQNRWPGDPVTRDPETRFHLWFASNIIEDVLFSVHLLSDVVVRDLLLPSNV